MARYKKQKDGLFRTTVSTKKYDENGKLITIPLWAHSSRELEELVGETKTKLKLGIYSNDHNKTFGEYAMHWYHTYPEKNIQEHKKYLSIIRNHIDLIYDKKISDITKSDIQELINNRIGHPDNQRMIKLLVNQVLESAIEDGLIYRNVCRTIHLKAANYKSKRRTLTDAEKKAITNLKQENTFSDVEQLYIDTLYVSGLRPEEALALSFADIKNCVIDVNKALTWKGGKHLKEPKTEAGYRKIDVPKWYQDEVTAFKKTHKTMYLFTDSNGNLMNSSTYKHFWKCIFDKINVQLGGTEYLKATDLTPYIFRHNYCTMLYYLHVDVKDASRIMGHSSIRVTLEIYTHLDSLKSSTQEKIANIAI